jgi:ADP-heptose:LPS heptosyltransferase
VSKKNKILVLRFSALGDVAMTVPVVWSLRQEYPDHEIVFVSRPFAQKLYNPLNGVKFVAADFNNKHKGLHGLINLFQTLKQLGPFLFVADLHGVIRSRFVSTLFRLAGTKVFSIDKGRKEKNKLTRKKNKKFVQLTSSFDRYREVFAKAGYNFPLKSFHGRELYTDNNADLPHDGFLFDGPYIGIAPFAKHNWKAWPQERTRALLEKLDDKKYQIFLFGAKGQEQEILEDWATELLNVHNLAGQLNIQDELRAMARIDVMLSMDSANMHLASLVGTPVVSIWGATHPYAGFYGWGQNPETAVQVNLECRPCSVFGNKPCHRGDFACMEFITVEMVLQGIETILKNSGEQSYSS